MDLILHVGLAKTATTTIQGHLNDVPGYLGKFDQRERDSLGKKFKGLISSKYKRFKKHIDEWAEVAHAEGIKAGVDRVIVSDENLLGSRDIPAIDPLKIPIDLDYHDLEAQRLWVLSASHLKEVSETVWTHGQVKVVLVLRNQPEWLASRYAQSAALVPGASQETFETWVRALLRDNPEYLDWSRRVGNLQKVLGAENVEILLMEDIKERTFWSSLFDFMRVEGIDYESVSTGKDSKKNALRSQNAGWRLKTPDSKEGSIELTESLKGEIESSCAVFNLKLADQLGRSDLGELGYYY